MSINQSSIAGNLTGAPRPFRTDEGKTRAYFTVALNPPKRPDGTQPDAVFVDCVARGVLAENVLASFQKGMPVLLFGRLENGKENVSQNGRTFDMTTVKYAVTKAGPDLTFATAQVEKNPYPTQGQGPPQGFGPGQGQGFGQGQPQQSGFGQPQGGFGQVEPQQEGFASPQGQPQGHGDPWQGQPQQGGFDQGRPQQGGFGQGQPQEQTQGFGQGQGF